MKQINTGSNADVMGIVIPDKGSVYAQDIRNPLLLLRLSRKERVYVQKDENAKDIVLGTFMKIGRSQAVLKLDEKIEMPSDDAIRKAQLAENAKLKADAEAEEKQAKKDREANDKKVAAEREKLAKKAEKNHKEKFPEKNTKK